MNERLNYLFVQFHATLTSSEQAILTINLAKLIIIMRVLDRISTISLFEKLLNGVEDDRRFFQRVSNGLRSCASLSRPLMKLIGCNDIPS